MAARETNTLRGELRCDEPLARYTSWRVGGPARCLYRPADVEDLAVFLRRLPADEPLLWLGLGSNLLVRDGGFPGTVIALQGRLAEIEVDETQLYCGAGASCARVARAAARAGLTGAAFLAGIPGTMGGALAMNAGAFGGETWERVVEVQTIDRSGRLRRRPPGDFRVAYRHVEGPKGEWFVSALLSLEPGDVAAEQARIRTLLERRAATQPTGQPSGGSTFRNPPGDHAARLIEAAGLKGYRIGGAEVSSKHANFIVNTGDATAADIEALMRHVQAEVEARFGVRLEPEVHRVGVTA
ncbi:MAG: UDP-N-acetylmuramate dehydrogenase [Gammaproteobacteria bacterium]|nr:MAG: UDP-N-acetylmuramate dehydrogenase [Gammaproteobacteria bacterium]